MHQAAVVVPVLSQLGAAAHVGDSKGKAAIDQRQAIAAQVRVVAEAIGAIADQHHRRAPVTVKQVRAIDQRHRDLPAVARRRPQAFRGVAAAVVTDDDLFLAQRALAAGEVDIKDRAGRDHRGIGVAHRLRRRIGVVAEFHRKRWFVGGYHTLFRSVAPFTPR